ncbi:Hypothetical protein A7982_07925 [Minicystis rosea]|nr:Hypothetical protein A7982_07925 [Minicystis rosea]
MTKVIPRPHSPRVLVFHADPHAPSPRERIASRHQASSASRPEPEGRETPARPKPPEKAGSLQSTEPVVLYGPAFRRVYPDARRSCVVCRALAAYLWKETNRGEVFLCEGCKTEAARRSTGFVGLAEPLVAGRAVGGSFEGNRRRH